jgi:hypothetical protein
MVEPVDKRVGEDKKKQEIDKLVDQNKYVNMSMSVPEEGTAVGEEDGST